MLPTTLLYTLAAALVAKAQDPAPEIFNNPADVVLRADFPAGGSQTVVGVIQFYASNGKTKVHVDITGLPKNSGIFSYHIHDKPVGIDGRCEETGGHFNPFGAPENCDAQQSDAYCELGDLSGKHGLINTTCFETFYYDPYLALDPSSPQYIGGKSINIHLVDKDNERLACGNIRPSKDPEDLLLLNPATEVQEVLKYEEFAGIKVTSEAETQKDISIGAASNEEFEDEEEFEASGSLDRRDTAVGVPELEEEEEEEVIEEVVEVVEDDEDNDSEVEEASDESHERDLDDLINEDILKKFSPLNSTNVTVPLYNVTGNQTDDGDDDSEENGAISQLMGISKFVFGVFVATVIGFSI